MYRVRGVKSICGSPNIERMGQGYTQCTLGHKVEISRYRSSTPPLNDYFVTKTIVLVKCENR